MKRDMADAPVGKCVKCGVKAIGEPKTICNDCFNAMTEISLFTPNKWTA